MIRAAGPPAAAEPLSVARITPRIARIAWIICLASITLAPGTSRAGAWLRAPGETYAKAAVFRTEGDREFDASGNVRLLFDPALYERGRYRETGASLYVEHGIGRDLTIVGDVLLKLADVTAVGRRGAGDVAGVSLGIPGVRLGARLPLLRRRIVAALEPSVTVPASRRSGDDPEDPSIGTGTTSMAAALAAGTGIPRIRGYAQIGGGYRARSGAPADEWFWDVEAGIAPKGPLRLRVRYDGVSARSVRMAAGGAAGMTLAAESGGQDAQRIAPTIALGGAHGEIAVTWRRNFAGRSALRGEEWEISYAFLGTVKRAPPSPAPPPG